MDKKDSPITCKEILDHYRRIKEHIPFNSDMTIVCGSEAMETMRSEFASDLASAVRAAQDHESIFGIPIAIRDYFPKDSWGFTNGDTLEMFDKLCKIAGKKETTDLIAKMIENSKEKENDG